MSTVKMKVETARQILEVGPDATEEDVKKAFRRLAKKCHPDLNAGDPNAEDRFKDLEDARDRLEEYWPLAAEASKKEAAAAAKKEARAPRDPSDVWGHEPGVQPGDGRGGAGSPPPAAPPRPQRSKGRPSPPPLVPPDPYLQPQTIHWTMMRRDTAPDPVWVSIGNRGGPTLGGCSVARLDGLFWDLGRRGAAVPRAPKIPGELGRYCFAPVASVSAMPVGHYADDVTFIAGGKELRLNVVLDIEQRPIAWSRYLGLVALVSAIAVFVGLTLWAVIEPGHTTSPGASTSRPPVEPAVRKPSLAELATERLSRLAFKCVEPYICRTVPSGDYASGAYLPLFIDGLDASFVSYLASQHYRDAWTDNRHELKAHAVGSAPSDPTYRYVSANDSGYEAGLILTPEGTTANSGVNPPGPGPWQIYWTLFDADGRVAKRLTYSVDVIDCSGYPSSQTCSEVNNWQDNHSGDTMQYSGGYSRQQYTPIPEFPYDPMG